MCHFLQSQIITSRNVCDIANYTRSGFRIVQASLQMILYRWHSTQSSISVSKLHRISHPFIADGSNVRHRFSTDIANDYTDTRFVLSLTKCVDRNSHIQNPCSRTSGDNCPNVKIQPDASRRHNNLLSTGRQS